LFKPTSETLNNTIEQLKFYFDSNGDANIKVNIKEHELRSSEYKSFSILTELIVKDDKYRQKKSYEKNENQFDDFRDNPDLPSWQKLIIQHVPHVPNSKYDLIDFNLSWSVIK
jgi:hypothetical protein